jgi:hypothetical protein
MSYVVYGLRLRGEIEVRYIGQTKRHPDDRLRGHLSYAWGMPLPTMFAHWLMDNEPQIETFVIDHGDDLADILKKERAAIKVCSAVGHKLFNLHGVSPEKHITGRIPLVFEGSRKRYMKMRRAAWADNIGEQAA